MGDSAHHEANDRILWGVIDTGSNGPRVGYIQVFVMGGFTDREDRKLSIRKDDGQPLCADINTKKSLGHVYGFPTSIELRLGEH